MLNRVMLIGNLGADPEKKDVNGTHLCKFTMATSETYKDKNGEKQTTTQWHRITVWGNQALSCAEYLKKGSTCFVEGQLQYGSYEKDGVKHYTTEVKATTVRFLSRGTTETTATNTTTTYPTNLNLDGTDLPF